MRNSSKSRNILADHLLNFSSAYIPTVEEYNKSLDALNEKQKHKSKVKKYKHSN